MQMNVVVSLDEDRMNAATALPALDAELPILALRHLVLFPTMMMPAHLVRKSSMKLALEAEKTGQAIAVFTQTDGNVENPKEDDLYKVGCLARVIKVIQNKAVGSVAILMGIMRVELTDVTATHPFLKGHVAVLPEQLPRRGDKEYETMYETLVERASELLGYGDHKVPEEMFHSLSEAGPLKPVLTNYMCGSVEASTEEKMELLMEGDIKERTAKLLRLMDAAIQMHQLKNEILRRTSQDLDARQRKHFLHEQMKQIEKELGDGKSSSQVISLREKAAKKRWPAEVAELFEHELSKLSIDDSHSFEYNMQLNYLETLVSLPWGEFSDDNLDLQHAQRILNRDHYGLKEVKERIIEHLAILRLRGDNKSPIICLVGPPGVGKTSLGKSIATALGREYVRISLGGVHDESEIRGHRRTYVGAMAGRIIKGLQKSGKDNPVFILDEIDKVGGYSNHGDPSSALLEVLDPEQNAAFHDNYLDMDYDLSHVMFIATANTTSTIPTPLLDRMEIINLSGYVIDEKVEIARRHLIDKVKDECGMSGVDIKISKLVLRHIINNYTRESGVRGLEKQLNKIMRKLAVKFSDIESLGNIKSVDELESLVGKPDFVREDYEGNDFAGVVTGLAWTQVGGEILYIETSLSRGKGSKLTLTGNLGDVMKESAVIALEYIKAHADNLGIDSRIFDQYNIHVHVPEGATPKDGPSAGVTMTTSMVSAMTQRKVRAGLAMTGEITLRGRVMPVGGIKEKILAAKRAGIKEILLCRDNQRNVEKIEPLYLKGLTFHYVDTIADVIEYAILPETVKAPLQFRFDETKDQE